MDAESVSSESISDDGDESLQWETDDTHFDVGDVGEKLTQIGIELIRSQDDIDVKELNGLISSLNTILTLKRGDESNGRKRQRHSLEDEWSSALGKMLSCSLSFLCCKLALSSQVAALPPPNPQEIPDFCNGDQQFFENFDLSK